MKHIFMMIVVGAFAASCASTKTANVNDKGGRGLASVEVDENTIYDGDTVVFRDEFFVGRNPSMNIKDLHKSIEHKRKGLIAADRCVVTAFSVPPESEALIRKNRELKLFRSADNNSIFVLKNESGNQVARIVCFSNESRYVDISKSDLEEILNANVKTKEFKRYEINYQPEEKADSDVGTAI